MGIYETLEKSLVLCQQVENLLEDDYRDLSRSLGGELYDKYKEVVLRENRIVGEIKEHLKEVGL